MRNFYRRLRIPGYVCGGSASRGFGDPSRFTGSSIGADVGLVNLAGDLHVKIALHLGDERFSIRVAKGDLTIARAETESPDATLDTDPATLLSLLRADRALDDVLATGQLRLAGDRALVELFTRLFRVPEQPLTQTSSRHHAWLQSDTTETAVVDKPAKADEHDHHHGHAH